MDDTIAVYTVVFAFLLVVLGMIGGLLMNDYQIARSQDPIAMACALGKKDACLAIAKRP